jgi:flagellar protein FliS
MRAIASYAFQRKTTASPARLVEMLLAEVLRRIAMADACLADGVPAAAGAHLAHARQVIVELRCGLDPSAAPELVARLSRLYGWLTTELIAVERSGDRAQLESIAAAVRPLHEAWTAIQLRGAA